MTYINPMATVSVPLMGFSLFLLEAVPEGYFLSADCFSPSNGIFFVSTPISSQIGLERVGLVSVPLMGFSLFLHGLDLYNFNRLKEGWFQSL